LAEKRKNESGSTRVRSVHGPLVGDGPEGGQE
jgi:hypothetical protein